MLNEFLLGPQVLQGLEGIHLQSIIEKYFDLPNALRISDMTGIGKLSPIVTSLSFLKSTTILHFFLPEASSFLGATKIGEFHGLLLGTMVPSCNIYSVSEPHPCEFQGSHKVLYLSRMLGLLLEWE